MIVGVHPEAVAAAAICSWRLAVALAIASVLAMASVGPTAVPRPENQLGGGGGGAPPGGGPCARQSVEKQASSMNAQIVEGLIADFLNSKEWNSREHNCLATVK